MIDQAARGKLSIGTPDWRLFYWMWVAALFGWAAWQRFALPLDPITDPDTWGYLAPALRKLVGAEFGHTYGRNFVYPAFVFSLLRLFGDFRAIVITQHLLGLVAGGVLLITWRRARVFVLDSALSRAAHDGLGLLGATIFLLAGEPMRFEMGLRPEGVCAVLASINLYLAIQFIACCFVEKRKQATVGYGIGTAFASVLLASVKPSFALAALVPLLPVGVFLFRPGWFRQKVALAGGAALVAALLVVPEHFLGRNDETNRTFLPINLFVNHATLIRDQIASDVQHGAQTPYPQAWLARIHDALDAEIAKSAAAAPGHYWSLGFDPDYLMHRDSIVAQLRREFDDDVPKQCAFYWFYYRRIWQERPLLVLRRIAEQMSLFYSEMCPAYNREKFLSLANRYAQAADVFQIQPYPELWINCPAAIELMDRTKVLSERAPVIPQPIPLRMTLSFLAGLYRPLLWIAVAVSAAVLFRPRYRRRLGWLVGLVLILYAYNAASCLEVAILNSLEVRRYVTVQVYFTLLAQLFALWLICEVALELRVRGKV